MKKTKEEIALKETMGIFDEYELGITGLANAMEKYAKQEAIEFILWAVKNHSVDYEGFSFPVWIGDEEYNAEQLFEVYLKSKIETIKPLD